MNPKVDTYFDKVEKWGNELGALRKIILDCGLTEELKWGNPCYSFQKSNIAIIGGLKDHCVLSFFKGSILDDPNGILLKPGENTQTVRLVKFTSVAEILKQAAALKSYLYEAIEAEKAGVKPAIKKNPEPIPAEFQKRLDKKPALKKAFSALTPGRQREYILYFSAPKQSKTRETRIEKYLQQILDGRGINE